MAKRTSKSEQFPNRVRFSWGFHDAAQAVREGWATPERNFGFGPAFGQLETPLDVLAKHRDAAYAAGWLSGYNVAAGEDQAEDSGRAWDAAVRAGRVTA